MTLGDAWRVLKQAAQRSAVLGILIGLVVSLSYYWRGSFEPVEMPRWATIVIWAGLAVVGYFSLSDLAVTVGGWLVHTGDFWNRASYTRRFVDVAALALLIIGCIYYPLVTWIVSIPIYSVIMAVDEWQMRKLSEVEAVRDCDR